MNNPTPYKVRKGTRSCWDCKRRKVRCRFASASNTICDNCKRRKRPCIRQAFPEGKSNPLTQAGDTEFHPFIEDSLVSPPTRVQRIENGRLDDYCLNSGSMQPRYSDPSSFTRFSQIIDNLLQAWPSEPVIQTILKLPHDSLGLFHGMTCAKLSQELFDDFENSRKNLSLPSGDAHPVTFARPMLLLAHYLETLSQSNIALIRHAGVNHSKIAHVLFKTVHQLVTSNEQLLHSIEGIECMMLESTYLDYTGDSVGAWHTANRAVLRARLMRLDQPTTEHRPEWLQPETRGRVDTSQMWFSLCQMTGYFSTMVGLSSQFLDVSNIALMHDFEKCAPHERIKRIGCVVSTQIAQRRTNGLPDWKLTQEIGQLLDSSKACQSLTWWSIPDFETCTDNNLETLKRLDQTMTQLAHYHLTVQTYVPHVLFPAVNADVQHARSEVVHASRQILERYVALGGIHLVSSFCGGVSCVAFGACVLLLFIRTQDNGKEQPTDEKYERMDSNWDENLVRSTLSVMQRLSLVCKDRVAIGLEVILRQLLHLRPTSAYAERSTLANDNFDTNFGCAGVLVNNNRTLRIRLPGLAILNFNRSNAVAVVAELLATKFAQSQRHR